MRIAYVDHSYHEKTRSTAFVPEILAREHEVDCFWDETWKLHRTDQRVVHAVVHGKYDVVVLFQVFWPASLLREHGLTNVVMIPMYDAIFRQPDLWWVNYSLCRFLNFSSTLHRRFDGLALETSLVQYFPEVPELPARQNEALTGFFWQRTARIPWTTVSKLIEGTEWKRFNLHCATDPGQGTLPMPDAEESKRRNIVLTDWFETRAEYHRVVEECQVYFAPRDYEGIGMGFLEAMALGKCVVAPDTPTHNEYIVHGVNGILYDPLNPQPLDFSNHAELGRAARETCVAGRAKWLAEGETELMRFVARDRVPAAAGPHAWEIRNLRHEIAALRYEVGERRSVMWLLASKTYRLLKPLLRKLGILRG